RGNWYTSKINSIEKDLLICTILQTQKKIVYHPNHHIAIAPTKNADRIEWFVEKAVEIGVGGIHFIQSKRTERTNLNMNRMQKIVISAMKQSKNIHQPIIEAPKRLDEILRLHVVGDKFIAHLNDTSTQLVQIPKISANSILLIGPEGDFTSEEVDLCKSAGYKELSLGDAVLRTETAGIFGLITMNLKS
ncbi:MAG TPA: RsmE family RNA methyltransferase, partial [Saprospiraceae bacterium]|nr:RsmE family RNA methyltransferase [Saprospiraceae bacterium]